MRARDEEQGALPQSQGPLSSTGSVVSKSPTLPPRAYSLNYENDTIRDRPVPGTKPRHNKSQDRYTEVGAEYYTSRDVSTINKLIGKHKQNLLSSMDDGDGTYSVVGEQVTQAPKAYGDCYATPLKVNTYADDAFAYDEIWFGICVKLLTLGYHNGFAAGCFIMLFTYHRPLFLLILPRCYCLLYKTLSHIIAIN